MNNPPRQKNVYLYQVPLSYIKGARSPLGQVHLAVAEGGSNTSTSESNASHGVENQKPWKYALRHRNKKEEPKTKFCQSLALWRYWVWTARNQNKTKAVFYCVVITQQISLHQKPRTCKYFDVLHTLILKRFWVLFSISSYQKNKNEDFVWKKENFFRGVLIKYTGFVWIGRKRGTSVWHERHTFFSIHHTKKAILYLKYHFFYTILDFWP